MPEFDLLEDEGALTAPAGCGKTQLIADATSAHVGAKPLLLLTHTNSGVAALRARLGAKNTDRARYRVATLDGWCMSLVGKFPARSGCPAEALALRNPGTDYPTIRRHARSLLAEGHINDLLKASYSRMIVDEYQDCSKIQHELLNSLSQHVPVCALGDSLQGIFGFAGNQLVDWNDDVLSDYDNIGQLETPWRWRNADAEELGQWLLDMRNPLLDGRAIDLDEAPPAVIWYPMKNAGDEKAWRDAAARPRPVAGAKRMVLVDSRSPELQRDVARKVGGHVVEAVDLRDLFTFVSAFEQDPSIASVLRSAGSFVSGFDVSAALTKIAAIGAKKATASNELEASAAALPTNARPPEMAKTTALVTSLAGVRVHRRTMFEALVSTLRAARTVDQVRTAAERTREAWRAKGRTLPSLAVGSTLLLKGLESESSVIIPPPQMHRSHLYVALTRASREALVCSVSREI